ncbi:MAG TPA: alanine--glyoxylate aminotransferase family protein [Candidatus Methanomethylia archaeon]|nr:alanine--glyoxylate aminotransferase family protein [Candidatus Methanomethylicia archaeon]
MLPGPTNVPQRVMRAMLKPIINHRGPEFHEMYPRLLEKVKKVLQTKSDVFVLTSSGTGAVEAALSNIVKPGDKVIVPVAGEFGSRLADSVEIYGGKALRIQVKPGDSPTAAQVEELLDREKDVLAVAVVYNETSTGTTVRELEKMGEIAKKYGALFIVDAISILGGDWLPVDEWNVDVCIAASQKCLAAPPGVSIISLSEDAWKAVKRGRPATLYFDLPRYKKYLEERKETPFTPALPLFFALDEALDMIFEYGLENWIRRQEATAKAFYSAFQAMGLKLFAKERARSNVVIAVYAPEGIEVGKFREHLRVKYSVVVAGGFGELKNVIFRVGNMGAVTAREVVTTVSSIESTLADLGAQVPLGEGVKAAWQYLKDL